MAQQSHTHPASAQDDNLGGPAVEVVRSEERLRVGREVRVTGLAVLRRYVVTETVEPLTDINWGDPEGRADDVEDEDIIDIDLEDETELEAEEVAERDRR